MVDGENFADKETKPVQMEVQYTPDINWVAFDISYTTKADSQKDGILHFRYNYMRTCIVSYSKVSQTSLENFKSRQKLPLLFEQE